MNIWHIILTVLMISVLALLHELGHFIAARKFGVTVNEFAVGMGPKIFSKKSQKTGIVYSVRAFPIGGFVSMAGEDGFSQDENAFHRKPVWQRMIITVAGSLMNILTGFVIMAIVVTATPELGGTTVEFFRDYATSDESGLMVGDEIIKVDGTRVHVADDLSYEIMHSAIEPIDIVVRRDGELVTLKDVTFPIIEYEGTVFGRPDFKVELEAKSFVTVVKHTFFSSISNVKMVWESLIDLVTGRYGIGAVSGPVGVAEAVSNAASMGILSFLNLTVMIAMNLGVFNLLPLPALDGGRFLFQIVELIRRKPVSPDVEGYVHFAGIVLLMLLMVVITFKDIIKLFG